MHFCSDELYAILMAVPFLGFFVAWLRSKLHHKHEHADCKTRERNQCDGCQAGIPLNENDCHVMGESKGYRDLMGCERRKYGRKH